jgi:predicted HTH domain antitoxin
MTTQMIIEYPETLPDSLHETPEAFENEARLAMAIKLFERKRISSGQAAQLAGMERASFLLTLHRYGAAMIDLTDADIASDFEND